MKAVSPPHYKNSEMMVLGCMLTNASELDTATRVIDDSYFSQHRGKAVDIQLVSEEL